MTNTSSFRISSRQRKVLDVIRRLGPISRAELVPLTDLTAGAISRHCRDLLLLRLVEEQDRRSGMRGQPAVPLVISGDGGFAIGISVSVNRLEMVALDYAGRLIAHHSAVLANEDMANLLAALDALSARLRADLPQPLPRLVGIGLALSGHLVADPHPRLHLAPPVSWIEAKALTDWSLSNWNEKIFFANNANVAALAELHAAENPDLHDMLGLNLGHGVGIGIIINRRIHAGVSGVAGEIGRMFPRHMPRPTSRDLLIALRSSGQNVPDIAALGLIDPDADPIVAAWIERVIQQLSPIVRVAWLLLTPQEIVLTSIPASIGQRIADRLMAALQDEWRGSLIAYPKIRPARLDTMSVAIGAAWLPIEAEGTKVQPDVISSSLKI